MEKLIGIEEVTWNDHAADLLAGATGSNPTYTINELQQEVASGLVKLMQVTEKQNDDIVLLGYICMFIDNFGGSNELVLQAGAAVSKEANILKKVIPMFEKIAFDSGCVAMRVHVEGGARERAFKTNGFKYSETVMRKSV